jgi:hypothetical protein
MPSQFDFRAPSTPHGLTGFAKPTSPAQGSNGEGRVESDLGSAAACQFAGGWQLAQLRTVDRFGDEIGGAEFASAPAALVAARRRDAFRRDAEALVNKSG